MEIYSPFSIVDKKTAWPAAAEVLVEVRRRHGLR